MPVNKHLNFFDITDFTPGLWNERGTSELVAPQNSLAVCTDYYPMKQGGLRAFSLPIAVGNTGIGANEECMGVWARNGVATRPGKTGGGADSFDALCVTIGTIDFKTRIYRMDQSNDETVWTAIFVDTAAASAGHQVACFAFFQDINGGQRTLITLSGNNSGLYAVGYAFGTHGSAVVGGVTDNNVTKLQTWNGPLVVSQARVMVAGGNDSVLHYSDVGLVTFTTPLSQLVNIAPNRAEPNISIISGIEPSDLLIGKEGAPWVAVSGDIASTVTPIREMGDQAHQRQNKQQVPQVPGGIAFIEGGQGMGRVFITDGRTFTPISDPVARFALNIDHMVGTGNLALLNNKLFAPNGLVYDFDTSAWFSHSGITNDISHWSDPYGGMVWCAGHAPGFDVKRWPLYPSSTQRARSGAIQTQKFTDSGGRAVEVREVQLYVKSYAATTAVCTLVDRTGATVSTQTITSAPADMRQLKFLFPNVQDEYLAVNLALSSDDAVTEVSTIERLRIGFGPGNAIN